MEGLTDRVRRGEFRPSDTGLFWHTGGIPALFGYARELVGPEGAAGGPGRPAPIPPEAVPGA